MSEDLLIAAPLRVEALLVESVLGRDPAADGSEQAARRARVLTTGMGPDRSKGAAPDLAAAPAGALLVLGFCGGLDQESVPGEVIVASSVSAAVDEGHEPLRVGCAEPAALAGALRARGLKVREGEIVCVSKIAVGERRAELLAGGALAVDMESVWLAGGAGERPFAVVRVVLDSPSHELLRPQALAGARRAASSLRRVAATLRTWRPAGVHVGRREG